MTSRTIPLHFPRTQLTSAWRIADMALDMALDSHRATSYIYNQPPSSKYSTAFPPETLLLEHSLGYSPRCVVKDELVKIQHIFYVTVEIPWLSSSRDSLSLCPNPFKVFPVPSSSTTTSIFFHPRYSPRISPELRCSLSAFKCFSFYHRLSLSR